MNIKKITNTALMFAITRLIEIFGIATLLLGLLLLTSLITYSPDDPNFIFSKDIEIKNLLGIHGSYVSDLFFQSVGLISYLISISFIFTGINIFISKDFFLIIENIFFIILYCIFGSIFFNFYYDSNLALYINGNGGFVGQYLNETFFKDLIVLNENISYHFLYILILILFLISINFNIKKTFNFLKKIINFFIKNNNKNYTNESEIISEYIPQDEIKNLIQEDLPFIKAEKIKSNEKIRFKLPNINIIV